MPFVGGEVDAGIDRHGRRVVGRPDRRVDAPPPGCPARPAHSWQAVAAGGTPIGAKGMMVAAKTMSLTAMDLFTDPALLVKARAEFDQRRGPDFVYKTRLDREKPALDYRK